jgi:hypothetical protein
LKRNSPRAPVTVCCGAVIDEVSSTVTPGSTPPVLSTTDP